MTTLFFIIMALAFVHFIYEGIIAPSIRFKLRLELFKQRDELRELKMEQDCELCDEAYSYLQDVLNNTIKHVSHIDLWLVSVARHQIDEETREKIAALEKQVEECPIKKVKEISDKQIDIIGKALFTNNGGLILYLIPLAVLLAFYQTFVGYAKKVLSLPERDIDRLAPPGGLARA
ncbi:MAG TPA: hypothetical protein VF544_14110 [Pyrinomonadaceae bacterium]|jgi:hypothetical protein